MLYHWMVGAGLVPGGGIPERRRRIYSEHPAEISSRPLTFLAPIGETAVGRSGQGGVPTGITNHINPPSAFRLRDIRKSNPAIILTGFLQNLLH